MDPSVFTNVPTTSAPSNSTSPSTASNAVASTSTSSTTDANAPTTTNGDASGIDSSSSAMEVDPTDEADPPTATTTGINNFEDEKNQATIAANDATEPSTEAPEASTSVSNTNQPTANNLDASTSAAPPPPPSDPPVQVKSARERKQERKDMELAELLEMMDEWQPVIPDQVTDYFLQKSGFETDDPRVKRLLALAAQRFVSSIATDSFQYARARTAQTKSSKAKGRARTVLTMEDLSAALKDYGVGADRAAYYL